MKLSPKRKLFPKPVETSPPITLQIQGLVDQENSCETWAKSSKDAILQTGFMTSNNPTNNLGKEAVGSCALLDYRLARVLQTSHDFGCQNFRYIWVGGYAICLSHHKLLQ